MRDAFHRRRDLILGLINEIPGLKPNKPEGAFYLFPDVSYYFDKSHDDHIILNADDLCRYLVYNASITTVTGQAFGAENCIRISYATSEEKIKEAMRRMKEALAKLK